MVGLFVTSLILRDCTVMKLSLVTVLVFFAGVLLAGCSTNKPGDNTTSSLAPIFEGESVRVYVDGRDKGVTPMTLHVSRSRGEYDVKLRKGKVLVRQFDVALEGSSTSSPERQAIYMDLENNNSVMGIQTFDLNDLESPNDTLYYIPYYASALSIDDVKYGLTLIISN